MYGDPTAGVIIATPVRFSYKSSLCNAFSPTFQLRHNVGGAVAVGAARNGGHEPTVRWAGVRNPLAVPIAGVLGVPLYANVAGVLPITEALVARWGTFLHP